MNEVLGNHQNLELCRIPKRLPLIEFFSSTTNKINEEKSRIKAYFQESEIYIFVSKKIIKLSILYLEISINVVDRILGNLSQR